MTTTSRIALPAPPPLFAAARAFIFPGGGGGPAKSYLHVVHFGASGLFALPHRGQRFGLIRGSFGVSSSVGTVGMTLGVDMSCEPGHIKTFCADSPRVHWRVGARHADVDVVEPSCNSENRRLAHL